MTIPFSIGPGLPWTDSPVNTTIIWQYGQLLGLCFEDKILICLFFASSDSVGWPKNLSGVACNVNVILTVILVIQNISKQGAVSVRIFMR